MVDGTRPAGSGRLMGAQWHVECTDVRAGLAQLQDDSVHCVITSPPYWGLRSYGTEPQEWGGAWRGELGSEPDPMLFVEHLADVFREVRRVLRPDGTLWLNMGSSYAGSGKGPTGHNGIGDHDRAQGFVAGPRSDANPVGWKPKDLIMTPFFTAEALRQDGWWLRQVIVWDKPACMPEAVTDRPTTSHEYVFLLSKSKTYYYDADAIREANTEGSLANGRNKRSVWRVTAEPLKDEHYAAFPTQLVEPMILAGTSAHGVCSHCGAPWRRTPFMEVVASETTGWEPTCACGILDVSPALVLDPFAGSGTVIIEALRHGRRALGFELSPKYVELATRRIVGDAPLLNGLPYPAGGD